MLFMLKERCILDNKDTNVLPEETLKEMFRKLNMLEKDSKEYNSLVEELIIHNVRLIPSFGKSYLKTFSVDELISIGWPALEKAVYGYDVNSGVPFVSYAKYWINTELKRNAYMEYMPYELSKREYEQLCKYYALCAKYELDNGREAEFEDIYPLMDLSTKQIKNLAAILDVSVNYTLDNTIDDDNSTTLLDRVASYDNNPYSGLEMVKKLLSDLEYDILIAKGEGYSDKKLASAFGLDVYEVKKIINEAKEKVYNKDVYDALVNSNKE